MDVFFFFTKSWILAHKYFGFHHNTMDLYKNPEFHCINTMDPYRNPGFHCINTMDPYRNPGFHHGSISKSRISFHKYYGSIQKSWIPLHKYYGSTQNSWISSWIHIEILDFIMDPNRILDFNTRNPIYRLYPRYRLKYSFATDLSIELYPEYRKSNLQILAKIEI